MKKFLVIIFALIFLGGFSGVKGEHIEKFSAEISIKPDSSFLIKESIIWNFGSSKKHGIVREISLQSMKIKFLKATDEFGNEYPVRRRIENNKLLLIIGDPNRTVTGIKTYNIFYTVQRGILFFETHDTFYWNITGNQWEVPIKEARAKIFLPTDSQQLKIDCFTKVWKDNCKFDFEDKIISFYTVEEIFPGEGLTVKIEFPKGIFNPPFLLWIFQDFWPILLPIFTFIYLLMKTQRNGDQIRKPIVPQYEPPNNLRPAEVSLILNQRIQARDLAATLIDLAVRGYVKIREIENSEFSDKKDYEIIKLKDYDENLLSYERFFLMKIFSGRDKVILSSLKKQFSASPRDLLDSLAFNISRKLTRENYYYPPLKTENEWIHYGVLIILIGGVIPTWFKSPLQFFVSLSVICLIYFFEILLMKLFRKKLL